MSRRRVFRMLVREDGEREEVIWGRERMVGESLTGLQGLGTGYRTTGKVTCLV